VVADSHDHTLDGTIVTVARHSSVVVSADHSCVAGGVVGREGGEIAEAIVSPCVLYAHSDTVGADAKMSVRDRPLDGTPLGIAQAGAGAGCIAVMEVLDRGMGFAGALLVWRRAWLGVACTVLVLAYSMLVTVGPLGVSPAAAHSHPARTVTFHYDGIDGVVGTPQIWVVPPEVFDAMFRVYGAQGGSVPGAGLSGLGLGGLGGEVRATLAVRPGEILAINVGGRPIGVFGFVGGWNGGGAAGFSSQVTFDGAGGGGASDVRRKPFGLSDRLLVAGGGGGGGGAGSGDQVGYAPLGDGDGGAGGGGAGRNGQPAGSGGCAVGPPGFAGQGGGGTSSAGGFACDGGHHGVRG
jgi:hypothetical protein